MKKIYFAPIAVIALVVVSVIAVNSVHNHSNSVARTAVLGASSESLSLKLNTISTLNPTKIRGQARPVPGNQVVTANVTVSNNSTSTLQFVPNAQVYITDQNNNNYFVTAVFKEGLNIGAIVTKGTSVNRDLDFEMPGYSRAKSLTFQLNSSTPKATIKL